MAPPLSGRDRGRHARARARRAAQAHDLHERVRARGQEAANFFKLALGEITVFQDELELPPAKVRVKVGGGIAGHNGLRSISSHIGNDYRRVRLGIGHPGVKELVHGTCCRISPRATALGRGAVRGDRRQCRAAGDGPRLDVPEQGASGDAGQGIFFDKGDDGAP
jgi:PTH1 family peptidyl-tRNA hydrolase